MSSQNLAKNVQLEVFDWLKGTRYASTLIEPLAGGSTNFIYKVKLEESLEDGTSTVLVKHGEAYMAVAPQNKMPLQRCRVENECLKQLGDFRICSPLENGGHFILRTPKSYLYDEATQTQVQEYLADSVDLKTYMLDTLAAPTPKDLKPLCHQLGKALALYVNYFHRTATKDSEVMDKLKSNAEIQALKSMINYHWMIDRVDMFPEILAEAKEVFVKVKEEAMRELREENLTAIHGDYSTGNILLPNKPLQAVANTLIFVIDWENAQLGVPAGDHGEMIGELLLLSLFERSDAGQWLVQGYAEVLGEQTEAYMWRTVLQVGVHLLAFGSLDRGFGTKVQIENVARLGRDIVVKAWARNREWFERSELACLVSQVGLE